MRVKVREGEEMGVIVRGCVIGRKGDEKDGRVRGRREGEKKLEGGRKGRRGGIRKVREHRKRR